MSDLDTLYFESNSGTTKELCNGCSVLEKSKPFHCYLDYESIDQCDVLFLVDSPSYKYGSVKTFSKREEELITSVFPGESYAVASSVKCPSIRDDDISADDMKICRAHLEATIDKIKPRLVFPCGNLPMKMLIKKSGVFNKRGSSYDFTSKAGHTCKVVPLMHPYSVIKEPRFRYLFEKDVKNGYDKYILNTTDTSNFKFTTLLTLEEVKDLETMLTGEYSRTYSVDIETTGLNFLTDNIQTIAFGTDDMNWVVPCDHKDSPFKRGTDDREAVWDCIRNILKNPKPKKIFHNTKFDLKFLIRYNCPVERVYDTKIMHHLYDENIPKGLMDLTKLYFPTELENL